MVRAQCLAQIGMSKAAVGVFKKDAKGRKRTENSLERRRVYLRRFRELISCSRLQPEEIGDAEPRRDVDRLDDERAGPDEIHDSGHRRPPILFPPLTKR
jgi:hypothetical protein